MKIDKLKFITKAPRMRYYIPFIFWMISCTGGHIAESQHQRKPNLIKIKEDQLILLDPGKHETPYHSFDGDVKTAWFPGWQAEIYPARLLVDLEGTYLLQSIDYYDGEGSYQISIKAGTHPAEDKMKLLTDLKTEKYNVWETIQLAPTEARYVIITIHTPKGKAPSEINFYGKLTGAVDSLKTTYKPVYPKFQNIMGVNSFPWIKDTLLAPFTSAREYLYWEWMEKQQGINEFSPSRNSDFQEHYRNLRKINIEPIACVLNSPKWLINAPDGKSKASYKPKLYDSPADAPSSYGHFARFWYQFVARFGSCKVTAHTQTINTKPFWTNAKPNPLISGEGLIKYVEIWNEPNQWWHGPLAKFTPFEYAAMLSACYDGHESSMGKTIGAKNADSTIKVVFGGLAGLNVDYIKAVDLWAKIHRQDQKFPADVLNLHHYCNNKGEQKVPKAHALPPESCDFLNKLRNTAASLKRIFPDKELWLTEYGYDTNHSTQSVNAIGSMDVETVQAAWIMRSMLIISASGFDKAHLYHICDMPAPDDALYMASGVVTDSKTGYQKKAAWYYLLQLRNTMNDFTFTHEQIGDDQVWQFNYINGKKHIKVVWSATDNDRRLKSYTITLPKGAQGVTLRQFTSTQAPVDVPLPIHQHAVSIDVDEIPKAIIFSVE